MEGVSGEVVRSRQKEYVMADQAVGKKIYPELRKELAPQLPAFLLKQRWFGGKARKISTAEVTDVIPVRTRASDAFVLIVDVMYDDNATEFYAVPVIRLANSAVTPTIEESSLKLSANEAKPILLVDALKNEEFLTALLELIQRNVAIPGERGELHAVQTTAFSRLYPSDGVNLHPKPVGAEQSNSSIIYGNQLILKFFRRIQEGINPDLEIGKFLTEKTAFRNVPPVAGSLEYHADGKQMAQGILQQFVPNDGDAWSFTQRSLKGFYQQAAKRRGDDFVGDGSPNCSKEHEISDFARGSVEPYLAASEVLARRTAEMHLALASESHDPAFAPETFDMEFQGALAQSILGLMARVFGLLRNKLSTLPEEWRAKANEVSGQEQSIASQFHSALRQPIHAMRTRIHGDYHLGQVLRSGSDFVIIDFEGEPARPIAERRIKRSPLQDVAGMLRSFHYAAFAPILGEDKMKTEDAGTMSRWAESWNRWVTDRFLSTYFQTARTGSFLPQTEEETKTILRLHLLEKAIYELGYELNNRPTWVGIPLQGISNLLQNDSPADSKEASVSPRFRHDC